MKADGFSMDAESFGEFADEKAFGSQLNKLAYLAFGELPRARVGGSCWLRTRHRWWEAWHGVRKLCS
jgi:hypothetical protein